MVTEFTPTERAVLFRFTFPENEHSYVVVDAFDRGSYIRIVPEKNRIIGYSTRNSGGVPQNFRNYFIVEFDKPLCENQLARLSSSKTGCPVTGIMENCP